jgi:hypothetical protein
MLKAYRASVCVTALLAASCSGTPSGPSGSLNAPTAESPNDQAAVQSYHPTLTVRNGTTSQGATRTYEFQISDKSDFSTTTNTGSFAVSVVGTVAEGANGTTSYTPDVDLQPTTRLYWRARARDGSSASSWTTARSFTTPIAGYSRAGELYDPLMYGSTLGVPVGATTFIPGKGVKLADGNSYVRYQLVQPLDSGEFSVEIEGLHPNGPGAKLKVFSMSDGTYDLFRSNYLMTAQYRGSGGNPDNCISFKMLMGDPLLKLEPDFGQRSAAIMALDPGRAYFWRATWSDRIRLQIRDGGVNGNQIYDLSVALADVVPDVKTNYNPSPHFAYLGANNGPFGEEEGSFPGAIYRNVWIGRGTRPASLGSALYPEGAIR